MSAEVLNHPMEEGVPYSVEYEDGSVVLMHEVFYEDEDVKGTLELFVDKGGDNALFIHCDVYRWSKSSLKKFREEFKVLKKEAVKNGFDALYAYTENPKWAKMVEKCEKIGQFTKDGKYYEVLEWQLFR